MQMLGILSTAYPAVKSFLIATKLAIHHQLRKFQPDLYAEGDVPERDRKYVGDTPMTTKAKKEDQDMVYYTTKTLLYSWSVYNIATNNANPIDVGVACVAAIETAHDVYKAAALS